jgi:hypothetical protein
VEKLKMRCLILILFALVMMAEVTAPAQTTNLSAYGPVNGTNNGGWITVSNVYIPTKSFLIQYGNITNAPAANITNAITVQIQVSVDGANSNWVTVATYNPSSTNALTEKFVPTLSSITLAMRARIITTNSLPVGTFLLE